jgi:hypothetical protein
MTFRPRVHSLVLGLAAAVLLIPAGRASAQGTSGILPNPITGRDLDAWSSQLHVTPEQRGAIDAVHQKYLEQYRQLREKEIEKYLQDLGTMLGGMWGRGGGGGGRGGQGGPPPPGPGGGGGMRGMGGAMGLDRATIERSLADLDRIMANIRALDEGLFDQAQPALDDAQQAGLPRVRQARERTRYRSGGTRMAASVNEAARVDLSAVYARLELPEAERQATDPLIAQYETRLTAETRNLYEATTRVFLNVAEIMEKQGFQPGNLFQEGQDPRAMFQAMRDAWAEAMARPRESATAISDLNRATVRRLGEFLAPENASLLRDRYLRRAYPEVPPSRSSEALRAYQAVLAQELPEALRSSLLAAVVDVRARRDAIVDEMMNVIDEQRKSWTPMGGGPSRRDREEALAPFRERLQALDESSLAALEAMLTADQAAIARAAAAGAADEDTSDPAVREGRGGPGGDAAAEAIPGGGPDPFLPQPITRSDIRAWRRQLELADKDWFILETLHEEYVASFDTVRQNDIEPLRDAEEMIRGGENRQVTAAQVDEAYELRARALDSIRQLDAALFADVKALVDAEKAPLVTRMAAARERSVYNRGDDGGDLAGFGGGRGGGGGGPPWMARTRSREAGVDLAAIIDGFELTDEEREASAKLVAEYDAAALDGFRRLYEAALRMRHEADRLRAERSQAAPGEDRGRARFEGFRQLMENQGREVESARRSMAEMNRASLETLASALPAHAEALRDEYKRRSFPQVYDDPSGVNRYLTAALELKGVSDEQVSRIKAIASAYAPADRQLADELSKIYAAATDSGTPGPGGDPGQGWRAMAERRNRIEVIEFDRRELNSRTLRQLRDALSEEQQVQLRLPAAPTRPDED